MIDLHIHSTASDGECLPYQIPIFGKESNVTALALTDHDTVDGLDEFLESAKDVGVKGIPGVELSCTSFGIDKVHIVGLFINHHDSVFLDTLEQIRNWRDERNIKILLKLDECGRHIEIGEVMEIARSKRGSIGEVVLGRPHIADVLIDKGYCKNSQDAFKRYLGERAPTYVPKEALPYGKAIEVIHASGGLAIWAHPLARTSMTNTKFKRMLTGLMSAGLDGVEAYYPEHTITRRMTVEHEAELNGLLLSGGSDYHGGSRHVGIMLGTFANGAPLCVPDELLERMKRRIMAK